MKKYRLIILSFILIVLSLVIGSIKDNKISIVSSSIPDIVKKGETFTIEVKTKEKVENIKFASSNEEVISVTDGGIVVPISKGKSILTAYYNEKDKTIFDKVTITVTE